VLAAHHALRRPAPPPRGALAARPTARIPRPWSRVRRIALTRPYRDPTVESCALPGRLPPLPQDDPPTRLHRPRPARRTPAPPPRPPPAPMADAAPAGAALPG